MKINLRGFLSNDFAKGVTLIAGGTASAQLLNTLLSPIITRLYTPEEYGVFTVYSSILGMLMIIGSLRYEWGIPIADNDAKAINLLVLSILILLAFVGVITTVLTFWPDFFLGFLLEDSILNYKYFIPLGIFFGGLYGIFLQWTIRIKNYKSISKTKINQSIVQNFSKISMGLFNFGPIGLIIGGVIGQSAGISTLAAPLIKDRKNILKSINKMEVMYCLKKYIKFPVFSAPSQLLNAAGLQLPVLFLASIYGTGVSGHYALANTIVNLPMMLIGSAIADVFYGEAATSGRSNPKRLKDLCKKIFRKLFIIGLIPLLILILLGPLLFSIFFGQNWYEAGVYSRILAFLVFTRFIFTPFGRIFSVFQRQKSEFILDFFRVILVLLVFWIANYYSFNSYYTISLYVLAMSVIYFLTFLIVNKVLNDEIKLRS
ncbi:lipopolysaccharide biosynthesis protein [Ureibacillus terrenus]|uniref:Oligosaccharide flippase family protein n=1 Tax=Ureibacillus terrenus TaxID=118246 RepID=A0A540UTA1_9BACL|nr:oligosaccharide flippase family protein [Ureibacillus terrenus]TQE87715.1 oligosaccharide flippase family protein [Ureibacillus terrenus]